MKIHVDTENIESLMAWAAGASIILAIAIIVAFRYFKNRTIGGMFDEIRESTK